MCRGEKEGREHRTLRGPRTAGPVAFIALIFLISILTQSASKRGGWREYWLVEGWGALGMEWSHGREVSMKKTCWGVNEWYPSKLTRDGYKTNLHLNEWILILIIGRSIYTFSCICQGQGIYSFLYFLFPRPWQNIQTMVEEGQSIFITCTAHYKWSNAQSNFLSFAVCDALRKALF